MSGNNLTGSISAAFGAMSLLHTFHAARNSLTGTLPMALGNMTSMNDL